MVKHLGAIQNKDKNWEYATDDWKLQYVLIPMPDGKQKRFFRFDYRGFWKMWDEKLFITHINKLKGENQ